MKVIIDRFEGEFAVVEVSEKNFLNIPREIFPNAKEGDIIKIEIDHNETQKRKENIEKLMNSIFKD